MNDKPERTPLVELKNGKLVVKQKPMSFEKMSETLQGASRIARLICARLFATHLLQFPPRDCTIS
jgi:chromatin assembly factor 1 subunit A